MSSEPARLMRKLRRVINQNKVLKRRNEELGRQLGEKQTALSLALASLRRQHPNWAMVPTN